MSFTCKYCPAQLKLDRLEIINHIYCVTYMNELESTSAVSKNNIECINYNIYLRNLYNIQLL